MCRLSLAWVTSENSTSNSNADILRLNLLHWTLSCLLLSPESSVDCPCPWFHANSLLFASLLSSRQLPSAGSRRQRPPAVQRQLPSAGLRRQLSFASPHHFRIRRDFMSKNPLSGFAPKQTKESSALAAHSYSATLSRVQNIREKKNVCITKVKALGDNMRKTIGVSSLPTQTTKIHHKEGLQNTHLKVFFKFWFGFMAHQPLSVI